MIKIDLNLPFLDLKGAPIEKATLGGNLSNILVSGSRGDALKFYEWAIALNKNKEIILDTSDTKTLMEFIEANDNIIILLKAQLLKAIDSCIEKSKSVKK